MDTSYDIVIFGVNEDQDPGQVAQRIAAAFNIPTQDTAHFINSGTPYVLKESVSSQDSEKYQKVLSQMGARVNAKPSHASGKTLNLVPKEKPKQVCPECRHANYFDEDSAPPVACSECGLVFEKYYEVQKQKKEARAIRDRLMKIQAMRDSSEDQKLQEEEEKRRRLLLEEQIRKELGLPIMIDRPWKLWSSAAITLILGVGLGVFGGKLLFSIPSPGRLMASDTLSIEQLQGPLKPSSATMTSKLPANAAGGEMPRQAELQSQEQLLALSHSVLDQIELSSTNTTLGNAAAPTVAPRQANVDSVTASRADESARLKAFMAASKEDAEWQWFIERSIQESLKKGAVTEAQRLADHLAKPKAQHLARARIAADYARSGHMDEASTLIAATVETVNTEVSPVSRVAVLTAIIPVLTEAKLQATAAYALSQALAATEKISDAGDAAIVWADIALAQAQIGLESDARASILEASKALQNSMASESRALAAARLSEVFARLGARDNATKILAKAEISVETIGDRNSRDQATQHIATAWVKIGNLDRATKASQALSSSETRDTYLLELLQEQAFSGDYFGLPSIAELIVSPMHRTLAYAYLAATNPAPKRTGYYFKRAVESTDQIDDSLGKIIVQGEVARLMTRKAQNTMADQLFAQAEKGLQTLNADRMRDMGWASLASNRARALDTARAQVYLDQVRDESLRASTKTDLLRVSRIIRYVQTASRTAYSADQITSERK